jgi:hypothetical protein
MLATLNAKQIVEEIVKDTVKDTIKDNDPHDALDISPDVVLASRATKDAPALAPDIAIRHEPKISADPEAPAAAPPVDSAIRAAANDLHVARKRSSIGKWFSRAFVTILLAGASAAATVAWHTHRDTAKQMVAEWMPALVASPSLAPPPVADEPAQPVPQAAAADRPAEQPAAPAQVQDSAAATATAASPDTTQSLQGITRDLAAMGQQIEQLKATVAELRAGQEQMAREMAKTTQPKPAEARTIDPRAKLSALPPRPAAPPVRKPKPVYTSASTRTYAPVPIAPLPQSQAAAVPPQPAPAPAPQAVADDDGPVVRPPMPVR